MNDNLSKDLSEIDLRGMGKVAVLQLLTAVAARLLGHRRFELTLRLYD